MLIAVLMLGMYYNASTAFIVQNTVSWLYIWWKFCPFLKAHSNIDYSVKETPDTLNC